MRPIKRILCPVDLSDVSHHAVAHAIPLARHFDAAITALHVWDPLVVPATESVFEERYVRRALTEHEIRAIHDSVLAWFAPHPEVPVKVEIQTGQPWKTILDAAASADLIVIGTHGAGGFEHLMLGSVAEKILRKAAVPVMTVPPNARYEGRLPYHKILCAVDFSDPSRAALGLAESIAVEELAELTILHVFEWPEEPLTTRPILSPEYRQAMEVDAVARLRALMPPDGGMRRVTTRLARGKPYREILNVAAEDQTDLIVMGVHGRNALDLMLFGSTTNQVVRRAGCPVMTLRA